MDIVVAGSPSWCTINSVNILERHYADDHQKLVQVVTKSTLTSLLY